MIVVVLTRCPASLKGDLSKWLFELSKGVYVGNGSTRIREKLWERIVSTIKTGSAIMVYSCHDEQRLKFLTFGMDNHEIVNLDGIELLKTLKDQPKEHLTEKAVPKGAEILKFPETEFVALDFETTGLNPLQDEITEVALVKFRGEEIVDKLNLYISTDAPIPDKVQKITGITPELLQEEGFTLPEALKSLLKFLGESPIVCHNASFDTDFLKAGLQRCGYPYPENQVFDTLTLSRERISDVPNYKLQTLCKYFNIDAADNHHALADAIMTGRLLIKLKDFGS